MADELNTRKSRIKTSAPRKVLGFFLLVALVIFSFRYCSSDEEAPGEIKADKIGTAIKNSAADSTIGNTQNLTKDYVERFHKANESEAQKAYLRKETNIPVLMIEPAPAQPKQEEFSQGKMKVPDITYGEPEDYNRRTTETTEFKVPPKKIDRTGMLQFIKDMGDDMKLAKTEYVTFELPEEEKQGAKQDGQHSRRSATPQTQTPRENVTVPAFLQPGKVVYCTVSLGGNSDSQIKDVILDSIYPADATGGQFFGKHNRYDEMMVVELDRFIHDGEEYSIRGLAINPDDLGTDVASDVNTHFWTRWGGLIISQGIKGVADFITASSSTQSYSDGTVVVTRKKGSLTDKIIAGAGEVGSAASTAANENFNRPPTVKLHVGAEVAVVILTVQAR